MKKTRFRSEVSVDIPRARHVLRALYAAYLAQEGLFKHVSRKVHAPQRKYFLVGVGEGDLAHRQWLYFTTMTDRREVSERVYESHARLLRIAPQLYREEAAQMEPLEIERFLKTEKVGSPGQSARYWPRCAETLFREFGGDPLRMYASRTINDLLLFKRGKGGVDRLPGFGPKILSLLSLFYAELGLMNMPVDAFPVDVHVQRFAISTGILKGGGTVVNEEVERALRPLLCSIILEEGWPALEISHAIWFLGNRLCTACYRNSASRMLCPSYDQCGGSISTTAYFRRGLWDLGAARHRRGGERTFGIPDSSPLFFQQGTD